MTEAELAQIEARQKAEAPDQWVHAAVVVYQQDISALLAYVRELEGIIHDMQQDNGYRAGVESERARVRQLIVEEIDLWSATEREKYLQCGPVLGLTAVLDRIPQTDRDPLPPDRLRAENERLRAKIERLLTAPMLEGNP